MAKTKKLTGAAKAWETRRKRAAALARMRSEAAKKAWVTRRSK